METKLAIIERAKAEIREDVLLGIIPDNTYSFEDLHNFVDANEYGGFTDDNFTADWDFVVDVQNILDAWMKKTGIDLEEEN